MGHISDPHAEKIVSLTTSRPFEFLGITNALNPDLAGLLESVNSEQEKIVSDASIGYESLLSIEYEVSASRLARVLMEPVSDPA